MKLCFRGLSGPAILAFALALSACGGNAGTQITTLDRSLTIGEGTAYATAEPVDTVAGTAIAPLAVFNSDKGQNIVLWGGRDAATGRVSGVREAAYWTDVAKPLYAKYDEQGGMTSVKDIDSGSYVTFSALDGSSVVASGFDAATGKTGSIRATLSSVGVTVEVLDDGSRKTRMVGMAELRAPAKGRGGSRAGDPLLGLEGVSRDSATRTRIITAIFRAAALVVDDPFDEQLRDVAGFLLLDQLVESYGEFTAKGLLPSAQANSTTPVPYIADLP